MTDLGFDGRVAIITGAGGGLGKQHALMMAARGALIVVNDLGGSVDGSGSDKGAAQLVVDEITAAGGEAVANTDSVATPEGGENIVKTAIDALGRVDIVINNAGIFRDKSFHNMGPDLVDPVLDVHLPRCVQRHRPRLEADPRAGLRPHRLDLVCRRHLRQLRTGQLRRRQDGPCRLHQCPRGRGRQVQREGQRHRAARLHADDRRPAGPARREAAARTGVAARHLSQPRVVRVDGPRTRWAVDASPRSSSPSARATRATSSRPRACANNWDTVTDQTGYEVPSAIAEETAMFLKALKD